LIAYRLMNIDVHEIKDAVSSLKYYITEAKRCTVEVKLYKSYFDIDFESITTFDGAKDEIFKNFLQEYIQNQEHPLYRYIGSIRDALKGKAKVLDNTQATMTLQYKADINSAKKELILENLNQKQ